MDEERARRSDDEQALPSLRRASKPRVLRWWSGGRRSARPKMKTMAQGRAPWQGRSNAGARSELGPSAMGDGTSCGRKGAWRGSAGRNPSREAGAATASAMVEGRGCRRWG
jgi:hypothetical protein